MTNPVTLPREVVERALKVLEYAANDVLTGRNAATELRAALEQPDHSEQNLNMIPAGWKPVPVEPTEAMLDAGCEAVDGPDWTGSNAVYRAMLDAAPQPPTTEQSSVVQPQGEQKPRAWLHIDRLGGEQAFTNEPPPSLKAKCQPLYTHSQNLRCKSTQARLATLWGYEKPQPKREPLTDEAKAVIDAARAAMDESTESYNGRGDISIASELAASLSLCLDEYDLAIERAHGIGNKG